MKKQLFSVIAALAVGTCMAQPSASWNISQNAGFTNPSYGIRFMDAVDNNVCWVLGYDGTQGNVNRNYVYFSKTTNGGTNWTSGIVYPSTTTPLIGDTNTYHIANLEGFSGTTAWVSSYLGKSANWTDPGTAGSGAIHRTTDGGATWVNMTSAGMFTSSTSFCNFVSFFTPSIGIVLGDPVGGEYEIWRTTNGGMTWGAIPGSNIPNPSSATEFAIVNLFAKQGTANFWFGTNEGRIFYSTDAGVTWNVSPVAASTSTITEIAFASPLHGVAYAVDAGGNFELYNTSNGGQSWSQVSTVDPDMGLNDVMGIPGTNLFASVGAGTGNQVISYSSDYGVTWTDWGSIGIQYLTVDFANNATGWAGSFSDPTNPAIGGIWKYSGAALTGTTAPTAAFSLPSDICFTGSPIMVVPTNSSTGSPAVTYTWSAAPAGVVFSNANAATPNITFSSNNTYTITLTVSNSIGTNASSQQVLVQTCSLPNAMFTLSTHTACTNIRFTTNNTSTPGTPACSYSWSASSPVTFSPSSVVSSPSIIATTGGVITITLVATNSMGSVQATDVVTVNVCSPAISYSIAPNPVFFCTGDASSATFTTTNQTTPVSGVPGVNNYTWSVAPNNGVSLNGQFLPSIIATITNTSIANYTVTLRARNASGTSSLTQVVAVDFCTGVKEDFLAAHVMVYPNPAHDQVSVSVPANGDNYRVQVINILGSVVYDENVANNTREKIDINLSSKPRGVYFVTVEMNRQKVTRKIILE